jgi:hypothetical protein
MDRQPRALDMNPALHLHGFETRWGRPITRSSVARIVGDGSYRPMSGRSVSATVETQMWREPHAPDGGGRCRAAISPELFHRIYRADKLVRSGIRS